MTESIPLSIPEALALAMADDLIVVALASGDERLSEGYGPERARLALAARKTRNILSDKIRAGEDVGDVIDEIARQIKNGARKL